MKLANAIAERFRVLLEEKKITRYRLAKDLIIAANTLQNFADGKNSAGNIKTIFLICKGLGVSVSEFFDDPMFVDVGLDIE